MSGLRDYSVVYFGNDWFAENRTSSHHIARRLAKMVPVLYIETPGSRSPQTSARDLRKLWRKLARALAPPQKVGEQFYVATIPQIPFPQTAHDRPAESLAGRVSRAARHAEARFRAADFVVRGAASRPAWRNGWAKA